MIDDDDIPDLQAATLDSGRRDSGSSGSAHVFIYYTHFVSAEVKSEIQQLRASLPADYSMFAMGCCNEVEDLDDLKTDSIQVRAYVRNDLRSLPYPKKLEGVNWTTLRQSPDLAILRFYRDYPDFAFYWIIEYDVRFTGSWQALIESLSRSDAALLCAHVTELGQDPLWMHWNTFTSSDEDVSRGSMIRAFLPFSRLSRELMQEVDKRCKDGWSGHPEVLWPTVARLSGMQIEEIGGTGPLVPAGRRGRYYSSCTTGQGIFLSTFSAWPFYSAKSAFARTSPPDILWHPVKE